ncbi:hypothetical protein Vretimale_14324 [Volvox reticuliferus]|uniref:G domain-containing protein n=1 Tax=Volvox reticuliferus TaxID=1737510 RepID=A0A8J4GNI3_9CHLO|nr:hypothetical protein Vretifemale_15297 [Volvox reticuliferus]GIM10755.1 hypothetical protein Vretimale_14324 [Volvox reticuliferus]
MKARTFNSGEVVLRPVGSTHTLVASTSPHCAAPVHPQRRHAQWSGRSLLALFKSSPCSSLSSRRRVAVRTSLFPSAAAEDALPGDVILDDQDAVTAAEVGGRNYLQLSDMSDESLQVRMVQWYPGHIARAERQLKAQLAMVDVVLEVRDCRIPASSSHPQVATWVGAKPRLLILNRADEVSPADLAAWREHHRVEGQRVFWTDGRSGDGVKGVRKELLKVATLLNEKRAKRGLQPRAVRACVIGFPNIGKSALINRLVNRRAVASAPKPGVTRQLRWVRVDEQIDLLDAPGVIPASFPDQLAAQRLAMCNDIGEAAYLASAVAAALVLRVKQLAAAEAAAAAAAGAEPTDTAGKRAGGGSKGKKAAAAEAAASTGGSERSGGGGVMSGVLEAMQRRYGVDPLTAGSAEEFVVAVAARLYGGDVERAGVRLLTDYRSGSLGRFALELPPDLERRERREAGLRAAADRREQRSGSGASTTEGDLPRLQTDPSGLAMRTEAVPTYMSSSPSSSSLSRQSGTEAVGTWERAAGSNSSGGGGGGGSWGLGAAAVNSRWVTEAEIWAGSEPASEGAEGTR